MNNNKGLNGCATCSKLFLLWNKTGEIDPIKAILNVSPIIGKRMNNVINNPDSDKIIKGNTLCNACEMITNEARSNLLKELPLEQDSQENSL